MTKRIVVVGEALIDLIQQPDGNYQAKPGGAPANVSIALARLGTQVYFAGRLSTDSFGEKLYSWLEPENIDLSMVQRTADPTTLAVASLDEQGKAHYSFYLNGTSDWGWSLGAFADVEVSPPAALVIGSLALAIDPAASVIENLAKNLFTHHRSTVAMDLNIRPGLGFERVAEVERIERQIQVAHIVKASDDDLVWLYPDRAPEDTALLWASQGTYVIMTRGADGATLFAPAQARVDVSAPSITLVDTVGAGDSFLGATLFGLQRIGALGAEPNLLLSQVSPENWSEILTRAAQVGAITCSRAGCNPPTLKELGL